MAYARGKDAIGICFDCGMQWPLRKLKFQVINAKQTRELHCPDCLDVDNPQLQIGKVKTYDPQGLQYPAPDPALYITRGGYSWPPISGIGLAVSCYPAFGNSYSIELPFPYIN